MQNELNQYIVELNKICKAGNATEHNYEDIRHKSISCMLSAIEIYNKPNFAYREESFAILAINAWELLLKAYIMRINLLAYVDAHIEAESVLTSETKNYFDFIQSKIKNQDDADENFDIAISIDIAFKKGSFFDDSIGMKYDPNGVSVTLSEENIRGRFPLSYNDVTSNCREKYSNFVQNANFHTIMKEIKLNTKLHHSRELDPTNKKSPKKSFFSTNIWKELDKCYSVKEKHSTTQKFDNK